MYHTEMDIILHRIYTIFTRIGLWKYEDKMSFRSITIKICYFIYYVSFLLSLGTGAILSDSVDDSMFLVALGLTSVVTMVRLNYILWKKKEISDFLHDIGSNTYADSEEFNEINSRMKMFLKFVYLFIVVIFGGFLFIAILPIFSAGKSLPLNIWFPWKNEDPIYWIAYVYGVAAVMFSVISSFLTLLIWYLMISYSIKYEILGKKFKKVGSSAIGSNMSDIAKQNLFFQDLIELVQNHQNLQRTITQFNSCFSILFFSQITTSGICICGSVNVLAFVFYDDMLQTVVYLAVLIYCIFDIFMILYFGNEIKLSSDQLSYCLFESNWIEQPKSCHKCILILTEVLKMPQELVIQKIFYLNLRTFTSILNFAYSMFNILQKFN